MSEEAAGNTQSAPEGGACFTPSDEEPILITESALNAFQSALKEEGQDNDGLRVSVIGGGCAGYQYNLDFEKSERMGDLVLNMGEMKVYLDSVSAGLLRGTTIDYVTGLNGTGFKFENPNAKRTCGCGHSFT